VAVSATEHGDWVELCAVAVLPDSHRRPRALPWVGLHHGARQRAWPAPPNGEPRVFTALKRGLSNLAGARITLATRRGDDGHATVVAAAITFAGRVPMEMGVTESFHTSADHSCLLLGEGAVDGVCVYGVAGACYFFNTFFFSLFF
jgi:hypothetical protein